MAPLKNLSLAGRVCNRLRREIRRSAVFLLGVDPWHAGIAPDREYPGDIIKHLNSRAAESRASAVEIGCGLGDIINHLRFNSKTGYDSAPRTLRAAALFSALFGTGKTSFAELNFPQQLPPGRHDAIILVNWIHEVAPEPLKAGITALYNEHLNAGGELVLDTVEDKEYLHNHCAQTLANGLDCAIVKIGGYARERTVYALQKPG